MAIVTLTQENFDTVINTNEMVLVDFWAQWCGPCRIFGEVYERLAAEYPDIVFGKVDVEKEQELAKDFKVLTIPLLMVFRKNLAIFRESGALTQSALEKIIREAIALDDAIVQKTLKNQQINRNDSVE